jgi:prepilin-type N-terminal cleavage/methylation domain-containing protein
MTLPIRRHRDRRQPGFTLIEIVLVMAIAGLILLIVFLALSGAQKSRRDFQRKNYTFQVTAALDNYLGTYHQYPDPTIPGTINTFESSYLPAQKDPLTQMTYSQANGTLDYRGIGASHSDVPPPGTVYIEYAHWCNRPGRPGIDNPTDPIGGNDTDPSLYVVWIGLESGGYYCLDNYSK